MGAELLRALAVLAEPPGPEHPRLAALLDLGEPPTPDSHTDLFVFQLYPHTSVYLGPEGMVGGEAQDRVAGFWRALGLAPPEEPDHLSTLLGLYARLGEAELEASDEEKAARWRHARRALLWEHLLSWLPLYLAKMEAVAPPFYSRWAALLEETLASEARQLEPPDTLPLHLRQAPPLPDPRKEGSEPFLEGLLAPVRCGMILVRDDLLRAARELELGARVGERRYVLKALLGQDAGAVLGWLGREARASRQQQAAAAPQGAGLRSFWTEHAAEAERLLVELAANAPSSRG